MPANAFGLCSGTYETRDAFWSKARCYNWYPSIDLGKQAQSPVELAPTPGLEAVWTLPNPPIRGLWAGDGRLFAVGGGDLYELFSGGTMSLMGGVLNAATPVQFAASGQSLLVATGDQIWRAGSFSGTFDVRKVLDGAISVVWLDIYYVALLVDSNTIIISEDDGVTWNPLDVAQKTGSTDRLVRLEAYEGHLWMFGRKTVIPMYDSGGSAVSDFPFEPISGTIVDTGTIAPWSVANVDRKLYWLGSDDRGVGRVYRSDGYTPTRVSNQAIEHLISDYLKLGTDHHITGSGYIEDGHTFYVLSFPLAKATLVYDLTTEMWHERARWNGTTSQWEHWRGSSFHAYTFGSHYVARTQAAPFPEADIRTIFRQSLDLHTEAGQPIRRYRSAPYVNTDRQWLAHHYLRMFVNSDGATPFVMRYLKDDMATWSTPRSVLPYNNEVKYRRLGSAQDRLYEISITDPPTYGTSIIEAYLHATPGLQR